MDEQRALADFPRKRCSAGALIRDGSGRLLVVKPIYRGDWLLPGGVVESDEDPLAGLRREVMEEVGIDAEVRSLWCVDYLSARDGLGESLHFLFDCAPLPDDIAQSIRPRDPEIMEVKWLELADALPLLPGSIASRLRAPEGHYLFDGLPRVPFQRSSAAPLLASFINSPGGDA